MKNNYLFLYLLLIFVFSCGQKSFIPPTDWKKENLKGEVKLVHEKTFYLDSTGVLRDSSHWNEIDSFPTVTREFNNKGYLLLDADYPCMMGGYTRYTYSEDSIHIKKREENSILGKGESMFKYDPKGRVKEVTGAYYTDLPERDSFVIKFEYDRRNNIIKETNISILDSTDVYAIRKYDEANNMIEENIFDLNNNQPLSKKSCKYDQRGNKIYTEFTETGGEKWGWIATESHDDKGNVVKTSVTYRVNGKVGEASVTEFRYEFDEKGNWVQMILTANGKDKEVHRRKIVYW